MTGSRLPAGDYMVVEGADAEETQRVRIDLAYDGAGFHGWAAQDGLRTVEGEIANALQTIFRRPLKLTVAGRTDSGVHAAHQVAQADLPVTDAASRDLGALTERLNGLLAAACAARWRPLAERKLVPAAMADKGMSDLVIHRMIRVSHDFDARFSALARHYRYLVVDGREGRNPVIRTDQWWCPYRDLDVFQMQRAADVLVGTHDFLSFCKPREGATTIRDLRALDVMRQGDVLQIEVSADAFCHSMVRSLVGALIEVGRGQKSVQWVRDLIREPGRHHGVPVAPARGLTLVGVDYPPPSGWAQRAEEARATRKAGEVCGDC